MKGCLLRNTAAVLGLFLVSALSACGGGGGGPSDSGVPRSVVITVAGNGTAGLINGIASTSEFNSPFHAIEDAFGNIYVADSNNLVIRKISKLGVVSTLAGGGIGSSDGMGEAAGFLYPVFMAFDVSGNILVSDRDAHKIRKVTPLGEVTTFAGNGSNGSQDGPSSLASFSFPEGLAVDSAGNTYVSDYSNNKIRKISPQGFVITLAGTGVSGNTDGAGGIASFYRPRGLAIDASGNLYVADWSYGLIRKVTSSGVVSTVGAGLNNPIGIAIDSSGNIYASDSSQVITRISANGVASIFAGTGQLGIINGALLQASFFGPIGLYVNSQNAILVAEAGNDIRKIFP